MENREQGWGAGGCGKGRGHPESPHHSGQPWGSLLGVLVSSVPTALVESTQKLCPDDFSDSSRVLEQCWGLG